MDTQAPASRPVATAVAPRGGDLLAGVRAALPLVVGLSPFGLSIGAAVGASSDPVAAWAGTLLIYSGSGQAILLQTLAAGAPVWTAVLATALVNARLIVYSTALAPLWVGAPLHAKLLGAATVIEPTWAVAEQRRHSGDPVQRVRTHYAGAAAAVTAGWLGAVTAGVLIGGVPGVAGHLAVAVPVCLAAMVAPHLRLPGGVSAVAAAAVTAVVARLVLPGSEVLVAMVAAAAAGILAGRRRA
jgi:predicted branched-subunit amino acid permease